MPLAKLLGAFPRKKLIPAKNEDYAQIEQVAKELGAELVPLGSAGYKTLAVVRGEVDAYMHGGGQWEWDVAAPAGVALHAGLHVSRIDGSPLVLINTAKPRERSLNGRKMSGSYG